jgi:hypothetical protein
VHVATRGPPPPESPRAPLPAPVHIPMSPPSNPPPIPIRMAGSSPSPKSPPVSSRSASEPRNFRELVAQLSDMGFARDRAEEALRLNRFSFQEAMDFLLSDPPAPGDDSDVSADHGGGNAKQYGPAQNAYMGLTASEKAVVDRLSRSGDPYTVLQTFIACNKDEASTLGCLS